MPNNMNFSKPSKGGKKKPAPMGFTRDKVKKAMPSNPKNQGKRKKLF
jgi:hypothetical protein